MNLKAYLNTLTDHRAFSLSGNDILAKSVHPKRVQWDNQWN